MNKESCTGTVGLTGGHVRCLEAMALTLWIVTLRTDPLGTAHRPDGGCRLYELCLCCRRLQEGRGDMTWRMSSQGHMGCREAWETEESQVTSILQLLFSITLTDLRVYKQKGGF